MMRADHQAALEDLMADMDGELTPAQSAAVRAHVADCRECQDMEEELRGVSSRLATWKVEEPPASLRPPVSSTRMARMRTWLPLAAALVVATGAGTMWLATQKSPPGTQVAASPDAFVEATSPAQPAADAVSYPQLLSSAKPEQAVSSRSSAARAAAQSPVQQVPLLARTARLGMVVTGFDTARAEVERVITAAGGFVGKLMVSGDRGAPKGLTATLSVPGPALDATLEQLKRLGRVTRESRDAEDVTQQSADLDARLTNARTAEKRLNAILANRTGDVSDVLSVEREIARVRGEIEQMEAARRTLDNRITFAKIDLDITEEQKAALDLGDQSISVKLRNAAVEGWNAAFTSVIDLALLITRAAPTILLWGLVLFVPYRLVRRWSAG